MDLDVRLVGDDVVVPCVGGEQRRYLSLDAAASASVATLVIASREDLEIAAETRKVIGGG